MSLVILIQYSTPNTFYKQHSYSLLASGAVSAFKRWTEAKETTGRES